MNYHYHDIFITYINNKNRRMAKEKICTRMFAIQFDNAVSEGVHTLFLFINIICFVVTGKWLKTKPKKYIYMYNATNRKSAKKI